MFSPILASLVCGKQAIREFELQLLSLQLWNTTERMPIFYIFTDTVSQNEIAQLHYPQEKLHCKPILDSYAGISRRELEDTPGKKFKSLWCDLMASKLDAIRWAFEDPAAAQSGVFFIDCDIVFLASFPDIPPTAKIALSPHYITKRDSDRFGYYNGGFGWLSSVTYCDIWERATHTSRFFEQAALEDVACSVEPQFLYKFPIQNNFGYWRMYQADDSVTQIEDRFGFNRWIPATSGIMYEKKPLVSVHSHWADNHDLYSIHFNQFLLKKMDILKNHMKSVNTLYSYLKTHF